MLYDKLDPGLQIALDEESGSLHVFLDAPGELDDAARRKLADLGAVSVAPGIYTANLKPESIEELSHREWVAYLRLAHKMRPA